MDQRPMPGGPPPGSPAEVAHVIDELTRHAGLLEPAAYPGAPPPEPGPPRIRRIVVGVDGSEGARWALGWARELALLNGARVWAVSVTPSPEVVDRYLAVLGAFGAPGPSGLAAEHRERAVRAAESAAEALRKAGVDARPEVASGPIVHALVGLADRVGADLLVVGSRGNGGLHRLLLGSVAEGVKHHSPASVLLAKGPPPPSGLLLPVDGSEASKRAACLGLDLARAWGVGARLLYVLAPLDGGAVEPELTRLEERAFGSGNHKEPRVEAAVEMGAPADVIVEAAEQAPRCLVVMGAHGLGGMTGPGPSVGGVSNAVSHRATASVLLVKPPHGRGRGGAP